MLDPSKRFATLVLSAGILVLLLAIVLGEGMGQNVLRNVNQGNPVSIPVVITPNPNPGASTAPYGPDWKQPQALAAAPDPGFPDPRVPPVAVPTATPRPTVAPRATATPDLAIPIWRRAQPLPTTPPGDQRLIPQSNVTPAPEPAGTRVPGPSPAPPR